MRIAAAADVHASDVSAERVERAFADLRGEADVVLLAGDLTTRGEPEQAEVLAARVPAPRRADLRRARQPRPSRRPRGRAQGRARQARESGCSSASARPASRRTGARRRRDEGLRRRLPRLGAARLRRAAPAPRVRRDDRRGRRDRARAAGDRPLRHPHRAPPLLAGRGHARGRAAGIFTYLGCERLATPIAENGADLVLHGHAHAGSFQGCIGEIPVYNVAVHVTGRNFWIVELDGSGVRRGGEVVEVREPSVADRLAAWTPGSSVSRSRR